jgi:polysaccharide pyruvyl transferase WcaK-like protein
MYRFTSLIVIGGGGLFFRQPLPSGWYFPLSLDELKSISTPTVTYAVGFNQEYSSESAWHHDDTFLNTIAEFHTRFTHKSVRDEWSRDLLEEKGITDVSVVPCPSAFLEPLPWFKPPFDESKKVVCIAPTDRSMTESEQSGLVSACTTVARWLSDNGYCPLVVFHDSYDDMQLATHLARNDLLCFLPNTAREAITVYSKAEAVIGMRGHSLILAAGHCIPVLGISYNKKVAALMELLSLQDYCLPKTCIEDPRQIINSFDKLQQNRQEIIKTLTSKKDLFLKANMEYSGIIAQLIT